eukprot:scaffold29984_cov53-Attheya_sp.AAC.1
MGRNRNRNRNRNKQAEPPQAVVGPIYMQLLRRTFPKTVVSDNNGDDDGEEHPNPNKLDVSIVLCGESHEDAMQVTRSGGVIEPKLGWVPTSISNLAWGYDKDDQPLEWTLAERNSSIPMGKAKEWAQGVMQRVDFRGADRVVLVWTRQNDPNHNNGRRQNRGTAHVLVLQTTIDPDDALPTQRDEIIQELTEELKEAITVHETSPKKELLDIYKDLSTMAASQNHGSGGVDQCLFLWDDMDPDAHALNQLWEQFEEEPAQADLDVIMEARKTERKKQNIRTWDDWFSQVHAQEPSSSSSSSKPNDHTTQVHLILENSVPPWEVELERNPDCTSMAPADDYIRCLPSDEDSDDDEEEEKADTENDDADAAAAAASAVVENDAGATNADDAPDTENAENHAVAAAVVHADSDDSESDDSDSDSDDSEDSDDDEYL